MDPATYVDPSLTRQDLLVLKSLLRDINEAKNPTAQPFLNGHGTTNRHTKSTIKPPPRTLDGPVADVPLNGSSAADEAAIRTLDALNDPTHRDFEPTVFFFWDLKDLKRFPLVHGYLIQPYIKVASKIVRVETDIVMLTHLLLYFATSVPSAIYLYYNYHWLHGVVHWLMQAYYAATYTLMMHQHIHMNGVLAKKYGWFDALFPYITNPLMGHTWNSYYYHHVKHHHVEGNGPEDLSSTIYYQRDELFDFLCYVTRFFFLIWLELPLYFVRKGKLALGAKAAFWEVANYIFLYLLTRLHWRATLFVFLLPFLQLRIALMIGNWGQHAFVDEADPTSDFRSSITLIDVASNRHCYNDGYHTSHHLNPRRHWRDHPAAFLKQKARYGAEHALVFRNIDYFMITVKLLQKDYMHLAKCLVPLGDQMELNFDQIANMLRTKTRRFTQAEIRKKFGPQDN
ncbi:conserved hypothetical protein [Uncinocarpus reesii 1704]|uniref:Fatty acid desaturase domain-containing protein n=1 Tax=Uncinocarpus reesii (strain UAMH 1704) TaxID=336963 RepID=C4JQ80_UNCRE|nr:uncharacterized protein UREG_03313 [Uncinocarpus reesii 1704]EEP78467.1 conserved hypothetical protein [Uncinocarpus reesii 1704]